jgi:hypothetical protein
MQVFRWWEYDVPPNGFQIDPSSSLRIIIRPPAERFDVCVLIPHRLRYGANVQLKPGTVSLKTVHRSSPSITFSSSGEVQVAAAVASEPGSRNAAAFAAAAS